jgi:phospholipase C
MNINHVVVLMLENRSFDCMLGRLYPDRKDFDGLPASGPGNRTNVWSKTGQVCPAWNDPELTAQTACIPNPDPGESFDDIHEQIHGNPPAGPTMSGFVDNYMTQPGTGPAADPSPVMHYFTPDQVPVISTLAKAFGVSDRWFASAPCQTWPNRFFAHCGTAGGYVNNSPAKLPFTMPTIFNRLDEVKQSWRIYFHDFAQAATLSSLWADAITHFHGFDTFLSDATAGNLPAYSFIEPRYYPDLLNTKLANDEHPPHNVAYGERLIAQVYNALRANEAAWKQTLFIITYDEHGGCYDHVPPPPATSPDALNYDGFAFGYYGVRVPAVICSPYVPAGSVIRPAGERFFDHTSISATLHQLFRTRFLTARDEAAPDLLSALSDWPDNLGPAQIEPPPLPPASADDVAKAAAAPPNDLQTSLAQAASQLPTGTANVAAHIARMQAAPPPGPLPTHAAAAGAATHAVAGMAAFLAPGGG